MVDWFKIWIVYISIFNWPPCSQIILIIMWWPGAEDKGSLWSVHIVLSWYVYPFASIIHIISLFCLSIIHTRHWPHTLQVHTSLLPPYMCYPRSWILLRLQTQLQYWTSRDTLGGGVMEEDNVSLHLLQYHLWHRLYQQQIFPTPLCIALWVHPCQSASHPVVKKPQGLTDPGGSSFMSIIRTNVLPALSLYGTSRRYGRLPPPGPRSCKFTPLFPGLP